MSQEEMKELVCEECGKTILIPARRTTQKVCRDCNLIRQNRRAKEHMARKKKEVTYLTCKMCGVVVQRLNPHQCFCHDCSVARSRMSPEKRHALDDVIGHIRASAPRPEPKPIEAIVTFDVKGKSIERLNAEARAFGMTYGRYVAACENGTIKAKLKVEGVTDPEQVLRGINTK